MSHYPTSPPTRFYTKRSDYPKTLFYLIILLTIYCCFVQLVFFFPQKEASYFTNSRSATFRLPNFQVLHQAEQVRELDFWVRRYVLWHKANRRNASRVAVFLSSYSGFGDNVRGMVNMWGYAVATKRLLLIDFRSPYPLGPLLNTSTTRQFMYDKARDSQFGKLLGAKMKLKRPMSNETLMLLRGPTPVVGLHLTNNDNPRDFALRASTDIYSEEHIPEFSDAVKSAITKILLNPSDELLSERHAFLKRHGISDGKPYFGFHARLGRGIGERIKRFGGLKMGFIADCAAHKLWGISQRYGIPSEDLRIFLATDTPAFRLVFKQAMLKKAPNSQVVHMNKRVEHFLKIHGHRAQVDMHLENIVLGDATEIVSFWSGFSLVARWRGRAAKLHPLYYRSCPHRDNKTYEEPTGPVFKS